MITEHNLVELDALVRQFFEIEDITYGSPKQPFVVRYRGSLILKDSPSGFDNMVESLQPHKLIPLLRYEDGKQVLLLMPEPETRGRQNPRLNVILFALTLVSVLVTGGLYSTQTDLPSNAWQAIIVLLKNGWPFAVSLLAILGTHEFGHYFAGRKNKVKVTLPFFIPFPLSLFGTMGAFINMRSLPKDRRALFDLSVSGPLSG
jgi:membrane-associated protease RseP (regulator of RpoE activity)